MMGNPNHLEPKLFYHGVSLEQRIPDDHPLRRIKQRVDFDFVRTQVADRYGDRGNPSVDPAVILKLMFLLYYEKIKSERALMAQLPMRLDWLWFCDYDLDDLTPNHSVLSKARGRWGEEVFVRFFTHILAQCLEADLIDGETIHVDSSMIDANASKASLQVHLRLVGQQLYEQLEEQAEPQAPPLGQRVSTTDPDARLGKKYDKTTLGYKDHRAVDDKYGIVTATVTTPANVNDEKVLAEVITTHQANTAVEVKTTVADKAYGTGENYAWLQARGITPCISHKRKNCNREAAFGNDQFRYDALQDRYICPTGHPLTFRQYSRDKQAFIYQAERGVCQTCPFFEKCVTSKTTGRQIQRHVHAAAVEWADHSLSRYERKRLMARRKYKAEGSFADAANNHGLKRARFRGLLKVRIQNLMIAAIQNLRKLLRHLDCRSAAVAGQRAMSGRFEVDFADGRRAWTPHRPFFAIP